MGIIKKGAKTVAKVAGALLPGVGGLVAKGAGALLSGQKKRRKRSVVSRLVNAKINAKIQKQKLSVLKGL